MGEDNIEPDHFIQVNYLSKIFFGAIQVMALDVMEFWKSFIDNTSRLDVQIIKDKSEKVAERV